MSLGGAEWAHAPSSRRVLKKERSVYAPILMLLMALFSYWYLGRIYAWKFCWSFLCTGCWAGNCLFCCCDGNLGIHSKRKYISAPNSQRAWRSEEHRQSWYVHTGKSKGRTTFSTLQNMEVKRYENDELHIVLKNPYFDRTKKEHVITVDMNGRR